MWTAQIESVEKVRDGISIIVSFSSDIKGEEDFNKEFNVTNLDLLKRLIQQKIDELTNNSKFADELQKLIGQPFDTTIVITPPTKEELAKQKYFKDVAILNNMIENIKKGTRKPEDPDYLAQLDLVKSEFLPEYEQI